MRKRIFALLIVALLLTAMPMQAFAMQIFVGITVDTGNSYFALEVEPTDRIEDIKEKIVDKLGIPVEEQVLTFANKILEEGNTLQDYSIQKDSTLYLTVVHSLTYTAEGNVITETCACGHEETATVNAPTGTLVYDGTEKEGASVSYSAGWKGGDLDIAYSDNLNAGTATASITMDGQTASVTFAIHPVNPASPETPVALNAITYGDTLEAAQLPDGWVWADSSIVPTVQNSGYMACYTPGNTTNYDWAGVEGWNPETGKVERTVALTVNKAAQTAPAVTKVDETVAGKADGKITDLTSDMEYRAEGEETYTPITGTELTDLAAGTYCIRYKGDENHDPSPDTLVTIAPGSAPVITPAPNPDSPPTGDDFPAALWTAALAGSAAALALLLKKRKTA